PGQDFMRF
uniref:FMRFamide-like neuropeptide PGQDFMRF-amide n=1 Tax=Delia radicum TaxID=30064 RepID=FAR5_DELRA|nr:RecName: Full=FMRFamide-like neuropeptide PGQDFMRF-amide [Delia radicum]